ncbi:uncharacterized protein LOC132552811 [Ylistrum balloti]|uniref:uncharacterized protein LOC132552811 n=1 Tax=Ylistrum balloti TaxID=509963 RepID=UPI002905EB01|nr:uncharacterized protein LOC132552811 [Ylistrum balloti]
MMETSSMNMLCQTFSLVLMLVLSCNAGRSLDVDEALQQILSESDDGSYFPSDSTDLDTGDQAVSDLIRRLQPEDQPSKRIFCNGFRGCRGRGHKRTIPTKQQRLLLEEPSVQKRPFCNGFFGCGNGKRSMGAPLRQPVPKANELETEVLQKRVFCGSYGCFNGKRSSLYNTLMTRLRSDKLDLGQADTNLPIQANYDLMRSARSARQTFPVDEGDLDISEIPMDDSVPDPNVRLANCDNCKLVKVIMPRLYAYRNEETISSPTGERFMDAEEALPREPITSESLDLLGSVNEFLPDETEEGTENIKVNKKCSPLSTSRQACARKRPRKVRRNL